MQILWLEVIMGCPMNFVVISLFMELNLDDLHRLEMFDKKEFKHPVWFSIHEVIWRRFLSKTCVLQKISRSYYVP